MNKFHFVFVLYLLSPGMSISQSIEAHGNVQDEKMNPVGGVNIILKGTPNGTVTNNEGQFSISIPTGRNVLMFDFMGYKSLEQEIVVHDGFSYTIEVTLIHDKPANRKLKSIAKISITRD